MFNKSPSLESHAAAIIQTFTDRFSHLEECRIAYLTTDEDIRVQGREKAGYVLMPNAQGQNKSLYEYALTETFTFEDPVFGRLPPDFIMVINKDVWEAYTPLQRVVLVFHELSHCAVKTNRDGEEMYSEEDGRPQYAAIGHDVEEFQDVAEVFGKNTGHENFAKAATGTKLHPLVEEVLKLIETGEIEKFPKRVKPPVFKCANCEQIAVGKVVQGWFVIIESCSCGGKLKPVKRG